MAGKPIIVTLRAPEIPDTAWRSLRRVPMGAADMLIPAVDNHRIVGPSRQDVFALLVPLKQADAGVDEQLPAAG
ncbi:hypothetical protein D3C81_2094920 [compost metagenome]